jgi:hypothetical protein
MRKSHPSHIYSAEELFDIQLEMEDAHHRAVVAFTDAEWPIVLALYPELAQYAPEDRPNALMHHPDILNAAHDEMDRRVNHEFEWQRLALLDRRDRLLSHSFMSCVGWNPENIRK